MKKSTLQRPVNTSFVLTADLRRKIELAATDLSKGGVRHTISDIVRIALHEYFLRRGAE